MILTSVPRIQPDCGFCPCWTVYWEVLIQPESGVCSSTPAPCRVSTSYREKTSHKNQIYVIRITCC